MKGQTHRMGENIFKWYNQQRINFQILKTAHEAQYKKKKEIQSKNGQKT